MRPVDLLRSALADVDRALAWLDIHANDTDSPEPIAVVAADLRESVRQALGRAQ